MTGWTSSESITALAPDLVQCLAELSEIEHAKKASIPTKTGGNYSYTYAALEDILPIVRPILAKHGLCAFQSASSAQSVVCVSVTLLHKSGEWISFDPLCLNSGSDPQSAGSAITYARRYTLLPALGLATEDDDGGVAMQGQAPNRTAAAAAPARREPTYRTPQEAKIREILAALPDAEARKVVTDAFKEEFGKTLSALEKDRHAEALTYVQYIVGDSQGTPPELAPDGLPAEPEFHVDQPTDQDTPA
jgi:hypothetical protein